MSNIILENIRLRKSLTADPYYTTYIDTDNSLNTKRIDNNTVIFKVSSIGDVLANSYTNISAIPLTDKSKKLATTEFVIDSLLTINSKNYSLNSNFNVNTSGNTSITYTNNNGVIYFPDNWYSLTLNLGGAFVSSINNITFNSQTYKTLRQTVTSAANVNLATGYWNGISQFTDVIYNTDLQSNNLVISFIFNTNQAGTYAFIFRKGIATPNANSITTYSCYVKEFTAVANTPQRVVLTIPKEVTSDVFDTFFNFNIGAIGSNTNDSVGGINNLSATNAQVNTWRRINTLTTENCVNWGVTVGNFIEVGDVKLEIGNSNTTNYKRTYNEELLEMNKLSNKGHAVIDANTPTTLTEGFVNRLVIISGLTANKTVDMVNRKIFRDTSNDRPMDYIEFYNSSNLYTLTINFPSITTLVSFSGVTSISIRPRETLRLVNSNTNANTWIPLMGTASTRLLYPFSNRSSLTGKNGYTILPSTDSDGNNTIIQYGVNYVLGNAAMDALVGNDNIDAYSSRASRLVTFPITFPNKALSVVATLGTIDDYIGLPAGQNTNYTQVLEGVLGVTNKTNNDFTAAFVQYKGSGNNEVTPFNWFAVGY